MSCPKTSQTSIKNQPFQTLFNTIGEGLILLDNQGYCQQINPAACQILGQSTVTLNQRHLNDLSQLQIKGIPPWPNPPNPQTESGQFQLQRADGKTYQIDYKITPNIAPEHHLLNWRLSHPQSTPEPSPETQPRKELDGNCLDINLDLNVSPITTRELEVFYRLQNISQNIPGVIYQFCLHPDGRCHFPYASGQFRDLYHIVPETLYDDASAVFEVVHPDDLERVQQSILTSAQTLTPWRCDYRIYSPDGKTRWILGQATPQSELDGTITWYGYLQDITRQKAIEENLRQSEQQLAKLIDNLNDLIFIADRDGNFSYVSHNFELVMGYAKNELLNQPFSQFIHPKDLPICIEVFNKALRGEKTGGTEYRVLHKDGKYYWHSGNGSPLTNEDGDIVGCLGVGRYIQEKKEAENALREQELRLKLALDGSQTGTWDWNLKTQEIVLDDKQWKAFLGAGDETGLSSIICQPISEWQDRIHPDDEPHVSQAILAHVARETEIFSHEYRIRCQDDSYKWMFAQGKVVEWDEAGQPQRFMGIYQDVSQRKADEIVLRELSQQLKKAQEIAKLGHWSFDIATQKITWSEQVFHLFNHPIERGEPSFEEHLQQIHPEDHADFLGRVSAATQGIPQNFDYRTLSANGTLRYLHSRIELEFQKKQVVRLFGVVMDITERVEVEQALRENDEKLRSLFDLSPLGISLNDMSGQFIEANPAITEITGYSLEEIQKLSYWDLTPAQYADKEAQQLELLNSIGRYGPYEKEYIHKQGHPAPVELNGMLITGRDGQHYIWSMIADIRDRKQAETALKDSQIRLKLALESSNIGLWDWHLDNNIVTFNGNWGTMLGYEQHEIGNNFYEWESRVHPQDLENVYADIERHLHRESDVYQNEHRLRCKDGSYKWILAKGRVVQWDEAGNPLRFIGTHNDIDARKQAELTLITLNQQLKKAQEVANLGYWSFDLGCQKITWSQEVFKIFGTPPEQGEPTYTEHLKQYHPEDVPQVLEHIEAAHLGIPQQYDFRLVRLTGEIRYCNARLEVEVQNGKATRLFGTVMDITERKQNEARLREALRAADAANQAKSRFLANMSHELRTPLNAILGFTDMMSYDPEIPQEQQGYLKIIHQSGEHLLQIINDILELSKIEAGKVEVKPAPCNFANLLQSLEYLFKREIDQKGIGFKLRSDRRLPKLIKTDELKLRQTLINLIGNAIKFTPKGEVSLRVRLKDLPSSTYPDSPLAPLRIEFSIADTGPGIAPAELSQLFEAFSQTETGKASKQGTGLGLAISRKFIEMMGGEIHVSSTLGAGTVFTFDIQAQPVPLRTSSVSTPQPRIIRLSPETEPPRILIVDDREDSRLLLRTLLRKIGFQLQEASQGVEALRLWETWQPQLILMDLQMPILDGYDATRQLRQREAKHQLRTSSPSRRTPIIALTANLFAEEQQAAELAGCDRLIAKPFAEQEFLKTIGTCLNLEYLYEDTGQSTLGWSSQAFPPEPTIERLAQMPQSWLMELQQYAKLGSDDLIFSLISRSIREDCPAQQSLAESLLKLTRNFQFERLSHLIQNCLDS
jgi:PAS domain S-box-containing protein